MKLRALSLSNVRKFGGRRATISGIGDGLTVVSEANEFGKSTFFDALHALFFQSYSSTAKPVKSLQPHAGGGIVISAEIETQEGRFAVEKNFLAKKGATVRDLARDVVIARDGEAEDWIARLIGEADHGPAGLLWVRQGVVGLVPADGSKSEKERLAEARRDLMSSVAGEIDQVTGGRRMDRLLARCNAEHDAIATSTGRPRGAWKEAADRAAALREEHDLLAGQCAELAGALSERARTEAELARIDAPETLAGQERDLTEARARMAAAQAHAARLSEAEQALRIAELEEGQAVDALARIEAGQGRLAEARALRSRAEEGHLAAAAALSAARLKETQARSDHEEAEARLAGLRSELAQAERTAAARRARQEAEALAARIETVRRHHEAARLSRAQLAANPATPEALSVAEQAAAEVTRLGAAVQARAAALIMQYDGAARITLNDQEVPGDTRLKLGETVRIGLPGIGQMTLDLPVAEDLEGLEQALADQQRALVRACEACGAEDLAGARAQARRRAEAEVAGRHAEDLMRATAPEGLEALEAALALARQAAGGLDETGEGRQQNPDQIAAGIEAAEAGLGAARRHHEACRLAQEEARIAATRCESERDAARLAADRAEEALGPEEGRSARHEAAQDRARQTARAAHAMRATLEELRRDAPDLATETANLNRATAAQEASTRRRAQLKERRAELSATIHARAEQDVEGRRDECAGELAALEAREARFEAERAALVRLRAALESAREGAREAYFGPVQEELKPLLGILHDEAALDWESETIMPGALRRGGAVEEFDTLSGGTQEQIAILTRLAFARLFARRGQHLPIVLDDALVYSDDDRIVKMFTALNRVALQQQIIVFSCRQLAFAALGGERPLITQEPAD